MPIQPINIVNENLSPEDLINELAKLQKMLRYLLNGQIDFENVRARSIKAENIEVGTLTAEEIAANTITADKMNVTELSAITANMGEVIAGIITGLLIRTAAAGIFPRIELSSTDELLEASADASNKIRMVALTTTTPGIIFQSPADTTFLIQDGAVFNLITTNRMNLGSGVMNINPTGSLEINGTSGVSGTVYVAATSGGPVTTPITFSKGIRTS